MSSSYSVLYRHHGKLCSCDWQTWKGGRSWTMSYERDNQWVLRVDPAKRAIFDITGQLEVLSHFGLISLREELPLDRLRETPPVMLYQLRQALELEKPKLRRLTDLQSARTGSIIRPWHVL